jgi:hypothetical protein
LLFGVDCTTLAFKPLSGLTNKSSMVDPPGDCVEIATAFLVILVMSFEPYSPFTGIVADEEFG